MLELLFADATRKGFLDARSARPPTVIVRPGAPNAAASSFASAVVREPLAGRPSTLPVSLDLPTVVIGVDTTVGCLARLLEIDGDALGSGRALNLPGLVATSARAARRALRARRSGDARARHGRGRPGVEAMVRSWPTDWRSSRADALGLPRDEDAAGIVRAYLSASGGERGARRRVRGLRAPGRRGAHASRSARRSRSSRSPARSSRSSSTSAPRCDISLKCDPEHGELLRAEHAAIDRGYHIDKRHWITITLDGSLPPMLIEELIEDSFDLVAPRRR